MNIVDAEAFVASRAASYIDQQVLAIELRAQYLPLVQTGSDLFGIFFSLCNTFGVRVGVPVEVYCLHSLVFPFGCENLYQSCQQATEIVPVVEHEPLAHDSSTKKVAVSRSPEGHSADYCFFRCGFLNT